MDVVEAASMHEHLKSLGLPTEIAANALSVISRSVDDGKSRPQIWREVSKDHLHPDHPFASHQALFDYCYHGWTPQDGPRYVWIPDETAVQYTNLAHFMEGSLDDDTWKRGRSGNPMQDYPLLHQVSVENPEAFWKSVLQHLGIQFYKPPRRIIDLAAHPDDVRWLPGCLLNIADVCLSRGSPDEVAIVWAEESNPSKLHTYTWRSLRLLSTKIAIAIRQQFNPGDAIAIKMPMTATAVAIYLGIILSGCVVVSIADSFAPTEVATRLKISNAKGVFTQDFIKRSGKKLPLYAKVVEAGAAMAIVLPVDSPTPEVELRSCDLPWEVFMDVHENVNAFKPHIGSPEDTINILFSSGTTGEPKAIPFSHLTPLRCIVNGWSCQDIHERDTVCWPTNLGWVMGPWLVFAALGNRARIALFQGSPLDRQFCQFVSSAQVSMLGVIPSIVRAWKQSGARQGIDWGCIRCFSSTGEASTPAESHWLTAQAGYKPVIEYCGGTEIGGAFLSGCLLQPQAPSTFSCPTFGAEIVLITADGKQIPHTDCKPAKGELTLVPPMLGTSQRLLNKSHHKVYYDGMPKKIGTTWPLRRHGDEMERLPGGYYCAHGRTDDTMNLGGIKVSSVEIERVVMDCVDSIKEVAAVSLVSGRGGPEKLVLVVLLREQAQTKDPSVLKSLSQQALRSRLNPLFKVAVRDSLPRTSSNKLLRRVIRNSLIQSKL